MTKEQLEKEAREKSLSYNTKYGEDSVLDDMLSRPQDFIDGAIADMVNLLRKKAYRDGLIDGAEPREKRITELETRCNELFLQTNEQAEQIKKMKCCGNCQKLRGRFDGKTNINILYCSDSDMKQIEVGFQMCCCKWEIKEND